MIEPFYIGDHPIGIGHPTYIIAEIGTNHNQNLQQALDMMSLAAEAGADAVKFQSIQFDDLYLEKLESSEFREWFRQIELDESWYPKLADHAKTLGVDFLSSPTYPRAIDLLEAVGVPAYKIASPQAQGNLAVVAKAAKTGKALIISIGYCEYGDMARVARLCEDLSNRSIVLLHCVSKYPTLPTDANLRFIQTLAAMTDLPTGYSDHTLGIHMPLAAIALGACVLEKHVTLDRNSEGPDHRFAVTFPEFKTMVQSIRDIEVGLGTGTRLSLLPEELTYRKNVELKAITKIPIAAGSPLTQKNVRFLRSSQVGISIDHESLLMQAQAKVNIEPDSLIRWSMLTIHD
ncbi:MAG: hypothetical protein F6J90_02030 [Moorea sp. SIOASIH]|uniref:N-acetylneuraminate synthase family protein n=1 Tax=Moorena sp. SIOASIH TaxID=2607817 RepID=UPI0013B9D17D|nr:N-acetylneuraminate synthase family protein [Moorena sp. SIOASIH]NEO35148.1 hypothetical protein [Moorena sp. SIOASIH]